MTTTITTIREPKTFQQIQDQQNELGKQSALESLNDNISKLIKAINDKDAKRETEQDRQLKTNQLELSKLQLRRAQLGLAKDEKYYQDYSRKLNERNNFGTRLGFEHDTSTSLGATGLSLLTGGLINPVILKQVIFPLVSPLKNITKALASFPGLIPMLFNRVGGKSSSAIKSDKDRILHGKLDQILGAIKDKTKSSKVKEEKEQSLLSKLLNALLLGAAGIFAVDQLLGGADGVILNTLKKYGPIMIAGYALGGWKGALVGFGLQVGYEVIKKILGVAQEDPTDAATLIDPAVNYLNSLISNHTDGNVKISKETFEAAIAGYALGGVKGALVGAGIVLAVDAWKSFGEEKPTAIGKENLYQKINGFLGGINFFKSDAHLEATAAGLMLAGFPGMIAGYAAGMVMESKALEEIRKYKDTNVGVDVLLDKWKNSDPLGLGISGITLGSMVGLAALGFMTAGPVGLVAGALLGLAGGYIYNQWKDISKPNELGYATKFDPKTGKHELIDENGESLGYTYSELWDQLAKDNPTLTKEEIDEIAKNMIDNDGVLYTNKKLTNFEIAKKIGLGGMSYLPNWWDKHGTQISNTINGAIETVKSTFTNILDTEYHGKSLRELICSPFVALGESINSFFNKLSAALNLMIYGLGNSLISASKEIPLGFGKPLELLGQGLVHLTGLKTKDELNNQEELIEDLQTLHNELDSPKEGGLSTGHFSLGTQAIRDFIKQHPEYTKEVGKRKILDADKLASQMSNEQVKILNNLSGSLMMPNLSENDRILAQEGIRIMSDITVSEQDAEINKRKILEDKVQPTISNVSDTLSRIEKILEDKLPTEITINSQGESKSSSVKDGNGSF